MCIGLLYCVDYAKPVNKAKEFYNLLQSGGAEKHEVINAKDKDWINICGKIFLIATVGALKGSELASRYSDDDLEDVGEPMTPKVSNASTAVLGWEDEVPSLLEDIFGTNSTIYYD